MLRQNLPSFTFIATTKFRLKARSANNKTVKINKRNHLQPTILWSYPVFVDGADLGFHVLLSLLIGEEIFDDMAEWKG